MNAIRNFSESPWRLQSVICKLLLCVLAACALCGCHRNKSPESVPSGFRVAVVVPGSTADQGWNYSAKEGAELIQKELQLAAPVSFIESVEASQRKSALRGYGREKYNLVLCHGYEFNQVVSEVAGEFPATRFIVSGYDQPSDRFGSIVYQLGEAAYLCGVAAGVVSQTSHVGFIAAQEVPPVVLCYEGFRKGFLQVQPAGSVRDPVYIQGANPWEDSTAAKIKTQALLSVNQPAAIDVLFQNADAASRGIFEAVEGHAGRIFTFGANRDQNVTTATRKIIGSAVIHVDRAFLKAARAVRDGTYQPHIEAETIQSGVIDCILNPKLADLVGAETAKKIAEAVQHARAEFLAGKVRL